MRPPKIVFIIALLMVKLASAQVIDYNRLDSSQRQVAARGLSQLCAANQQWFATTCTKHPDGSFDPVWTKRMLLNKFSMKDIQQYGDLFTLMMAYNRMQKTATKQSQKPEKQKQALPPPDSTRASLARSDTNNSKHDTDRSTKEDRAWAIHNTTLKLQAQLSSMKESAKF